LEKKRFNSSDRRFFLLYHTPCTTNFFRVSATNGWCTPEELQILVPLINQSQAEKIPGLEDLTKVYLDRVLDYMITQVRIRAEYKNMKYLRG
jgi:hypothetical protein